MKVLISEFAHLTNVINGASMYHHNLAKAMQSWGWEVVVCSHQITKAFEYDGVPIRPHYELESLVLWCDGIITTPGKMRQRTNRPMIYVQHNEIREIWDLSHGHVLYCANHVAQRVNYKCKSSHVFWPPNRYANAEPLPANPNGKITLVNCNANKGGYLLPQFAKQMPEYEFLGVCDGYSHQIKSTQELPNLTYVQGDIDLRKLLADTSILIMPSEKEGMPTLAQEAMALGVPVVGSDIPAFHELGLFDGFVGGQMKRGCRNYFIDNIRYTLNNYDNCRNTALSLARWNESNERDWPALRKWLTSCFS